MPVECESLVFKLNSKEHLRLKYEEAKELYELLHTMFSNKERSYIENPKIFEDGPRHDLLYPYCENSSTSKNTEDNPSKNWKWDNNSSSAIPKVEVPTVGKYNRRKKDKDRGIFPV